MTNPSSAHVEELRESLAALIRESESLRGDVRVAEAARRRNAYVNTGVLVLLVIFVILVLTLSWQNNRLAHEVESTNQRVADCTTAGGSCYERGAARTRQVVSNILRADIYTAECERARPTGSGRDFDVYLEGCVAGKLAATPAIDPAPQPGPSPSR